MKAHHLLILLLLACAGCTGGRNYRTLDSAIPSGAARFLELAHSAQIATLHFPAGTYVLEATDDNGYYYRAPRQILEKSFSGPLFHDGGLYLGNSRRESLRGYVDWYNGLVQVGNLSRAEYELHD